MKKTVRILKDFHHFKKGDVKQFSKSTANSLVKSKFAELIDTTNKKVTFPKYKVIEL